MCRKPESSVLPKLETLSPTLATSMTISKYLILLVGATTLPQQGIAQKVTGSPESLRDQAEEVEAECIELDAEVERQRVHANSLLEALLPQPEEHVPDPPYYFYTTQSLSIYREPFSSEVAFDVSEGRLLTVERVLIRSNTFYAEVVVDEQENRRGFIRARHAGPKLIEQIRDLQSGLSAQRDAIARVVEEASGNAMRCRNRAGRLRNTATRIEDENRRVENERRQVENERRQVEDFYASTPDVLIDRFYPGRPNSADGVDLHVRWRFLNPNKTIRYIRFTARPYNRVGDARSGQIGGHSQFTGYITGPIDASTRARNSTWGTAWYNSDISCVRLTRVRIEYTDGTSYTYVRELPSILAEGVVNSCTMEAQMPADRK